MTILVNFHDWVRSYSMIKIIQPYKMSGDIVIDICLSIVTHFITDYLKIVSYILHNAHVQKN